MIFENYGFCFCCNQATKFIAKDVYLRSNYFCDTCGCIPRERVTMYCIEKFFPHWKESVIHESSPIERGTSIRLRNESKVYIASQFFPDVEPGTIHHGFRCENIEAMTFDNESIDLHVTQDVMEHVFSPDKAFKEISRTLKQDGMYIFTVPLVNKTKPTQICAEYKNGEIVHLMKPEYHGNPVDNSGSLMTRRWGYDITDFIYKTSGMISRIIYIDALELGIRAELNEVIVCHKPNLDY